MLPNKGQAWTKSKASLALDDHQQGCERQKSVCQLPGLSSKNEMERQRRVLTMRWWSMTVAGFTQGGPVLVDMPEYRPWGSSTLDVRRGKNLIVRRTGIIVPVWG